MLNPYLIALFNFFAEERFQGTQSWAKTPKREVRKLLSRTCAASHAVINTAQSNFTLMSSLTGMRNSARPQSWLRTASFWEQYARFGILDLGYPQTEESRGTKLWLPIFDLLFWAAQSVSVSSRPAVDLERAKGSREF